LFDRAIQTCGESASGQRALGNWQRVGGGLWSQISYGNAAEGKDFTVSFFVIIVVVPYLIAVVAFFKPAWLERFVREWPWEKRRRLDAGS
jgi:hypothetical protein